ncbi:Solute carrier family 12 member 2 [Trichinella pseudospiralis]|uniref:Solute carrier family 12 member 2 n=1 Tax=Trichinella pseudospiralis TaxID=6337 RepID=A0A0V1FYD1_TRIPS|nr:Solute carrier family 12 member 2 [Trichinella pseudospiralis]
MQNESDKENTASAMVSKEAELQASSETKLTPGELQKSSGTNSDSENEQIPANNRNLPATEPMPHLQNYADKDVHHFTNSNLKKRPSLSQLHSDSVIHLDNIIDHKQEVPHLDGKQTKKAQQKLGWIEGVLIRSSLSVFGVIFYLRLTWIGAQAGIALGSIIIVLSSLIGLLTALSLSALCTNGRVQSGGVYYIVSRTLGPEFGGSIGIIFCLANVTATAITITGFAETVVSLMGRFHTQLVDGEIMDIRIIGWITGCVLLMIVFTGVNFEAKAQIVLMVVLVASVLNYYIGTFIPVSEEQMARGVTGYDRNTLKSNFFPDWRGEDFFSILAIYFPAVAGFMAGANISGDLKHPESAIPKGTLWSMLITGGIYLSVVWVTGSTVLRDASGSIEDLRDGTLTDCAANFTCQYGTQNSYEVLELEGAWGPLVTAGIFAASLSSALGAMISGPKLFQAVAKDKLFPKIEFFAEGHGRNKEPRRAIVLLFVISMAVIGIGRINVIAPIISNFFMATYALINYACFDASFAKAPGFRPSFTFYNKWMSLIGALICFGFMFLINWWAALITTAFAIMLYVYLLRRKPDVNWGSSLEANSYLSALRRMLKLQFTRDHIKTYRPQILLLCGSPVRRPELIDFVSNITKNSSLLICGHVILGSPSEKVLEVVDRYNKHMIVWLKSRRIYGFYSPVIAPNLSEGAHYLLQTAGMSYLKPNILFLGYKNNWIESNAKEISEYFQLIHYAFDYDKALIILRLPKGFDISSLLNQETVNDSISDNVTVQGAHNVRCKYIRSDGSSIIVSPLRMTASMDSVFTDTVSINFGAYDNPRFHDSRLDINSEKGIIDGNPSFDLNDSEYIMHDRPYNSMRTNINDSEVDSSIDAASIRDLNFEILTSNTHEALKGRKKSTIISKVMKGDKWKKTLAGGQQLNVFKNRIKKAVIDVWWLCDDGGLTILIPHLLTLERSYLEEAKLRVFTVATDAEKFEEQKKELSNLLDSFRIDVKDVTVIPDISQQPKESTINEFNQLISKFKVADRNSSQLEEELLAVATDNAELSMLKYKTYQTLRIREELLENSKNANLVVITLPVPRRNGVSAALYLSWLEMLSRDLPPTLLIRGNQKAVLTCEN